MIITRTEASNADKTLIENVVRELIRQNILINKKTTQGLDYFKISKNVNQITQTSSDQTMPDPTQTMNATKTPDTEDIKTAPSSPLILSDIRAIFSLQIRKLNKQLLFQILIKNHSLR